MNTTKDKILSQGNTPYNLGLALSGGSVKGFAHLGVIEYLLETNNKPDIISGTSAGALMGAFYADGYHPQEIMDILGRLTFSSMTNISFGFGNGGIFGVQNFTKMLKTNLRHKRIEDLEIPFRIVATDLDNGKQKVFTEGNLVERVVASCSIPVIFKPMIIDDVNYVDGGLFRNFPVSVIREDCKKIIGVNLNPEGNEVYKKTLLGTAIRSWDLVFRQNGKQDRELCDVLLETTEVTKYRMFEFSSSQEIMQCGYDMAKQHLNSISL